jgi:hypothetical protein
MLRLGVNIDQEGELQGCWALEPYPSIRNLPRLIVSLHTYSPRTVPSQYTLISWSRPVLLPLARGLKHCVVARTRFHNAEIILSEHELVRKVRTSKRGFTPRR